MKIVSPRTSGDMSCSFRLRPKQIARTRLGDVAQEATDNGLAASLSSALVAGILHA
jgi:hypothetical protein